MKTFGYRHTLAALALLGAAACAQQLIAPKAPSAPPAQPLLPPATAQSALSSVQPPPPNAPAPAPSPLRPATSSQVLTPQLLALRAKAQAHILGKRRVIQDGQARYLRPLDRNPARDSQPAPPPLGRYQPLLHPAGLTPFYRALEDLSLGARNKVRILAYGASHTQGDFYTGYLRHYLQSRFGNGGPGFVQLARVNSWYRMLTTQVESKGFKIRYAQRKTPPEAGPFGLLGASATARFPYAYARVKPRRRTPPPDYPTHNELFYLSSPEGGGLKLRIDGKLHAHVPTRAAELAPGYYSFPTLPGKHEIEVRPDGKGPVTIFGLTQESPTPGIVVDTLGINGTRASNMLLWDQELWAEHLRRREPSLILLAYGTNEATDVKQPPEEYRRQLGEVLDRLRRFSPDASCLLIGPGDFPKKGETGWHTRSRLLQVAKIQSQVSQDKGCAYFDTLAIMGGPGSMHQWVNSKPPLAAKDHVHFTPRGYVWLGMLLGDAIMANYDAAHGGAPSEEPRAELSEN